MTAYVSLGWTAQTLRSAKNFNYMETMYSCAEDQIDAHGHPDAHYLKAESDAKFFPQASGLDADMIDGLHVATLMGSEVPLGLTLMHEGEDEDFSGGYLIADGRWHQADGGTYNGIYTPDMRGYFPKCPNAAGTTGTGGNATVTMSGTVTYADHLLTTPEIPSHYHTMDDVYYTGSESVYTAAANATRILSTYSDVSRTTSYNHAAADEAHDHGTSGLNLNAVNLTPRWKAYYFITKVSA